MYERESQDEEKKILILRRAYLIARIGSKTLAELSFSSLVAETPTTVCLIDGFLNVEA